MPTYIYIYIYIHEILSNKKMYPLETSLLYGIIKEHVQISKIYKICEINTKYQGRPARPGLDVFYLSCISCLSGMYLDIFRYILIYTLVYILGYMFSIFLVYVLAKLIVVLTDDVLKQCNIEQ